jgi:hypothetical protein
MKQAALNVSASIGRYLNLDQLHELFFDSQRRAQTRT